jgi:hypothetical protein
MVLDLGERRRANARHCEAERLQRRRRSARTRRDQLMLLVVSANATELHRLLWID